MTFTYVWTRCSTSGKQCSAISGATAQTYVVAAADIGRTLRINVTARNASGSATAVSNPTAVVTALRLVVQKTGPGAAQSLVKSQTNSSGTFVDDGRIVCGSDCSDTNNASGRLVVAPYEYSRWAGWTGACTSLWLDCDFTSSSGAVSATAQLADDGRTPASCDGAAPPGAPGAPRQLTAGQPVGFRLQWQSSTRLAYTSWIGSYSPVYLIDGDGSCGLGSPPERLFHNFTDSATNSNAVVRAHQTGVIVAPDSKSAEASTAQFAFSPDGSQVAYSAQGLIHVADATTGSNDQLLGYQDADNFVATLAQSKLTWAPDGAKIAFRGRVVEAGVLNDFHAMVIVYPGQGSQRSTLDVNGGVCGVWKTSDSLYAAVQPNPDNQMGAVDLAGNVTHFGHHNDPGCPTSRSNNGRIVHTSAFGPNYLIVSDAENQTTEGVWQEDLSGPGLLSADGSKLAWVDWNADHTALRLLAADAGGGSPTTVFSDARDPRGFAWSPDGKQLAYTWGAGGDGTLQVWAAVANPPPPTLLERFTPELRLDQQEVYRPDSAATITDNFTATYTNRLIDGVGTPVAASDPSDPSDPLSLDYLGSRTAIVGVPTTLSDYLDEVDGSRDVDAQRMHANPLYANKVYGRAIPDGTGTLLQYWMFYYNNPKQFGPPPGGGDHEGDWEMIQVQIDGLGNPTNATFSQHDTGESCSWSNVEHPSNNRPIVYVAEQSHANYFTAGDHLIVVNNLPDQLDYADGNGEAIVPGVIDVSTPPSWMQWAGKWGGADSSPNGPSHQGKWQDPVGFMTGAAACTAPPQQALRIARAETAAPSAPVIHARLLGRRMEIRFTIPRTARGVPQVLVTSVDGSRDRYAPTGSSTLLHGRREGRIVQRIGLSHGPFVVRASLRALNGARSRVVVLRVP